MTYGEIFIRVISNAFKAQIINKDVKRKLEEMNRKSKEIKHDGLSLVELAKKAFDEGLINEDVYNYLLKLNNDANKVKHPNKSKS
jgi:hypothetical protein